MSKKFKLGFLTHVANQGDPRQVYDDLIRLFIAAEELGFDGGWIAQHHLSEGTGNLPSPLIFHAALARHIKRMELGTGIIVLPLEEPVRLAEDAVLVDALSEGRLQLGLGSGGANASFFNAFGEDWQHKTTLFQNHQKTLQSLLGGAPLGGSEGPRLEPPAPSLGERLWHSHASAEGAVYAAQQGNGFLIGTAVHHPLTVQKPLADAYLQAWDTSRGSPRIGVIRAVIPAADKATAQAELADDVLPFDDWLRREGLAKDDASVEDIIRLLNVHHGTADDIITSLKADPSVFQYADYFIPVIQSKHTDIETAIARLQVIATQIAPAFGWSRG